MSFPVSLPASSLSVPLLSLLDKGQKSVHSQQHIMELEIGGMMFAKKKIKVRKSEAEIKVRKMKVEEMKKKCRPQKKKKWKTDKMWEILRGKLLKREQ